MKPFRPRFVPVFYGFREDEWLGSPPPVSWCLHFLLPSGELVPSREDPAGFMDTKTNIVWPLPYFVPRMANA